ncbi:uncharacterized protein LAESUDRAFT_72794 [Laetiporus sulphureus 93-53]|uniref:Uncharacterized protein n=1 Tax=Laetiporus sulphureus 93-53 TaxID=1314785 RepID=A0A165EZL3_9APHY|nr:uncharacterized protein LAESUDRAFT_72794 [Laetiporus sulphureus 93-53]KZT08051.1 hypothetical protein LAESUDRAFT_72794 [Laetiporus sulphureus 93-53]
MQRKPSMERRQAATRKRLSRRQRSDTTLRDPHVRARLADPQALSGTIPRPPWPSFTLMLVRAALLSQQHPLHLPILFAQLRARLADNEARHLTPTQRSRVYSRPNSTFIFRLPRPTPSTPHRHKEKVPQSSSQQDVAVQTDEGPETSSMQMNAACGNTEHAQERTSEMLQTFTYPPNDLCVESAGRNRRRWRFRVLLAIRRLSLHCLCPFMCT